MKGEERMAVGRLVACAIAAVLAGTATAAAADAPGKAGSAENGAKLYRHFCSHCHGPNMVNPGTASYDLRKFPLDEEERFFHSVTKGKNAMPAWGETLKPEELADIWAYVRSRGKI
jgi:mono/diheme cytochrome c family protein